MYRGSFVVELALPRGCHAIRQTVHDDVDARPAHVHQLVDAEDDGHARSAATKRPVMRLGAGCLSN